MTSNSSVLSMSAASSERFQNEFLNVCADFEVHLSWDSGIDDEARIEARTPHGFTRPPPVEAVCENEEIAAAAAFEEESTEVPTTPPASSVPEIVNVSIHPFWWIISCPILHWGFCPYETVLELHSDVVVRKDRAICGQRVSMRPYEHLGRIETARCCNVGVSDSDCRGGSCMVCVDSELGTMVVRDPCCQCTEGAASPKRSSINDNSTSKAAQQLAWLWGSINESWTDDDAAEETTSPTNDNHQDDLLSSPAAKKRPLCADAFVWNRNRNSGAPSSTSSSIYGPSSPVQHALAQTLRDRRDQIRNRFGQNNELTQTILERTEQVQQKMDWIDQHMKVRNMVDTMER